MLFRSSSRWCTKASTRWPAGERAARGSGIRLRNLIGVQKLDGVPTPSPLTSASTRFQLFQRRLWSTSNAEPDQRWWQPGQLPRLAGDVQFFPILVPAPCDHATCLYITTVLGIQLVSIPSCSPVSVPAPRLRTHGSSFAMMST